MKKISIIIITILMLSLITIPVMAADAVTTSLSLSGSEIKQEQEVTVTVKVNGITATGTKALSGKISFDKNILEFKSHEFVNGWAGAVSTDGTSFTVYTSSSTSIEQIVKLTFKVKASATVGSTTINVNNITLALEEGNGDPESEIQVSGSSASLKVVSNVTETKQLSSIRIEKVPTKVSYVEGEKFDKAGIQIIATYSDGSTKTIEDYTVIDGENLKANQETVTIRYVEGGVTKEIKQNITVKKKTSSEQTQNPATPKDPTTSTDKEHAKTGLESTILTTGIIMLILFSIVFYRKYRNIDI